MSRRLRISLIRSLLKTTVPVVIGSMNQNVHEGIRCLVHPKDVIGFGINVSGSINTYQSKIIYSKFMVIKKLQALHDRVLVEPLDLGERKSGAILIPDTKDDKVRIGKVVSTGPGKMEFGTKVEVVAKPGDVVVLPKMIGQRVEIEDKEYWLIPDREIIAVVELEED